MTILVYILDIQIWRGGPDFTSGTFPNSSKNANKQRKESRPTMIIIHRKRADFKGVTHVLLQRIQSPNQVSEFPHQFPNPPIVHL